jgi:predicted DsbA family dithiol-disulfide isomerase
MPILPVDIWSDLVCPWCYIGKRRFESALARFEHRDGVVVTWHSFELDPAAPAIADGTPAERLSAKYGMPVEEAAARQAEISALAAQEGLAYDLPGSRGGNSFDAHRLTHLAAERGIQGPVVERLMRGYFCEREPIGDAAAIARLAAEAGLDAGEVREVLQGDRYADAVRGDERLAGELGISGVPFFVLDGRYGVSGAQGSELLLGALTQAWDEAAAQTEQAGAA